MNQQAWVGADLSYGISDRCYRGSIVDVFVCSGCWLEAMAFRGDVTQIVGLQGCMMIWAASIPPKEKDSDNGPVMVTLEYSINQADAEQLTRAMQEVRAMRKRRGTLTRGLVKNTENNDNWLEFFIDGSWLEHMRHHGRVTKADRRIESTACRFLQLGVELVMMHHFMHVARR